jgi:2'-5' RNA ligase
MLLHKVESLIFESSSPQHLYVSVSLSKNTIQSLHKIIKKYNLPNAVKDENFHITLFTSSKTPNIPLGNYKFDLELDDIKSFTAMSWFSNKKEFPDKRLFVLEFSSFTLYKLRRHLIDILNLPISSLPLLSNKFHITLSYNIGSKQEFPMTKDVISPFPIEITSFKCQSKM